MVGRIQLGHRRPFAQTQRIEIGRLVAPVAVGVDDPQHCRLLFGGLGAESRRANRSGLRAQRELGKGVANWPVRDLAAALGLGLEGQEILPPVVADRVRIAQEAFVQFLDEGRVTAEQR